MLSLKIFVTIFVFIVFFVIVFRYMRKDILDLEDNTFDTIDITQKIDIRKLDALKNKFASTIADESYGKYDANFVLDRAQNFIRKTNDNYKIKYEIPQINQAIMKNVSRIRKSAKIKKATKKTNIIAFNDKSKTHTSDKQNVHDHNVGTGLSKSYRKICDDKCYNTQFDTIDSIRDAIAKNTEYSEKEKKNALVAVDKMSEGLHIIILGDTENNVLLNVWNRSYHPSNTGNKKNIQSAVIKQLSDCVENDRLVCGSGRTARVIGSLAVIDCNDAIGKIVTTEDLRNEVFSMASKSLNDTIKIYTKSSCLKKQMCAKYFESDDGDCDPEMKQKFVSDVLAPIKKFVSSNQMNNSIIEEVIAGIDV